jgi:hypothetical protein
MTQTAFSEATVSQRVALGGIQTERDAADRHLGPTHGAERRNIDIDEQIIVLPIESILSIKYSSEVKKGHTEFRHARLEASLPPVKLSCCKSCSQWCGKTFCCRKYPNNRIRNGPEQIMTMISGQEAERWILITIEYVRYSNIDTPSHLRVLSIDAQHAFYKENLHKDILEFYLIDNNEYEQADFDLKRKQGATLCRLVTQLKSMVGHYPDEATLEIIIGKHETLTIGDPPKESIERMIGTGTAIKSSQVTVPLQTIKNKQ